MIETRYGDGYSQENSPLTAHTHLFQLVETLETVSQDAEVLRTSTRWLFKQPAWAAHLPARQSVHDPLPYMTSIISARTNTVHLLLTPEKTAHRTVLAVEGTLYGNADVFFRSIQPMTVLDRTMSLVPTEAPKFIFALRDIMPYSAFPYWINRITDLDPQGRLISWIFASIKDAKVIKQTRLSGF